ncbi:hypothetical protein [Deinococcus ruber]|uniref:Uncharacterized protein n=1 Tax=Deinococcus ruber TaxID=1848197 RepID=A0A918F7C3_9DEIO|nr:hypothetical protein [Deinococcus ruber]GGR15575.1 hypothetical protein GCM10008957_30400 [Deinococcus ruber]
MSDMISCHIRTVDDHMQAHIDARPLFAQATPAELREVEAHAFVVVYPASEAADHDEAPESPLGQVLDYALQTGTAIEMRFDPVASQSWINLHRLEQVMVVHGGQTRS